jgi:hypothetical protein
MERGSLVRPHDLDAPYDELTAVIKDASAPGNDAVASWTGLLPSPAQRSQGL